ncbi:hypothetical protein FGIG_02632 [Fasciola gigantica]|uniref:Uncharacterized protein n=1 Tax=Fasciola gigantica TaxID=46835 RepID=A0A504YZB8_FASGI|nr:hypothetical protein FGIG_02632 [Fasciola gigantica]
MTARYSGTPVSHDLTGSEVSNSDSLIQEFQEFEAQAYSGTLFNEHDRNPSRSMAIQPSASCIPNQMGNHSVVTPSKVRTPRPQKSVLVEDPSKNKSTKPQTQRSAPCDSLGYQRISDIARTGSISGSGPVEENEPPAHLPEVRSKPRIDSNFSHNKNAMKPSPSSMAFFAVPDSASNAHTGYLNQNMTVQWFPPALSHSQSTPRLNPQSVRASPFEHPYPRIAERDFSTPIRRTESAYLTTAKPVVSIDKNGDQLELVNPHPVLPHAKEDPIETHDLVVAEMAAQGVVWAPPRNAMDRHSHSGTLSASRTADNGRLAGDTRWYSAGIEEEEVLTHPSERWTSEEKTNAGSDSFISGSVTISDMNNRSRTRMTQYSSQRTIKPSTPAQRRQHAAAARDCLSLDWSSAQQLTCIGPDCHERTGGIGIRQIDWTLGMKTARNPPSQHQDYQQDQPAISQPYNPERQNPISDNDVSLSPDEVHLDLMTNLMELDDIEACLELAESPTNEQTNFTEKSQLVHNCGRNFATNPMSLMGSRAKCTTVVDSGVLSSPSRSDRDQDLSSLSSSPMTKGDLKLDVFKKFFLMHSLCLSLPEFATIVSLTFVLFIPDNLRAFEDLFVDLMDRYNKLKQMDSTNTQASRLYHIMKRLYVLAITANGHSSVIPTPEELESVFQLDGDTQKLSEDLEKFIRTERELSACSSYSNVSGRNSYLDCAPPHTVSSSVNRPRVDHPPAPSTSGYVKNTNISRREHNPHKPTGSYSDESSSAQDSGLSTPPVTEQRTFRDGKPTQCPKTHPVPGNSKLHCMPINESDSSPTAKSVPTYSTQGHPSDSGLPGSLPANKNSWSSPNDPSKLKAQMMSHNISGSQAPDYLTEAPHVDDSTKKRMEAIEAGIRFLQQKMIEVCSQKQASSAPFGTPPVNRNPETSSPWDSSDMTRDQSANPARSASRSGHQRKRRPSAAKFPTQQQEQQHLLDHGRAYHSDDSHKSAVHSSCPVNDHSIMEGYGNRQRPETDNRAPVSFDTFPLRCYGTTYGRCHNLCEGQQITSNCLTQNGLIFYIRTDNHLILPPPSDRLLPMYQSLGSEEMVTCGGLKPQSTLIGRFQMTDRSPADVSSDDDQPESPENDADLDEISECTDPNTCSPHGSDSQGSETDCLEQKVVSSHPRRESKPRSILRPNSLKASFSFNGRPPNSSNRFSRRSTQPCHSNFDRAMSVAYDLHQLPPQSAFVVPPHHFGGSMPVLVDPHECCAAHTANPHNTRLDACQQSRARPSKSMQPPSEFCRPPPPKPAFFAEPHLVSTCGTCGGSGRVSVPYPDPIRRPLVPNLTPAGVCTRRVLSFANSSSSSACEHFNMTPYCRAKHGYQRQQLVDSSDSSSSSGTSTTEVSAVNKPTASTPQYAPDRSMIENRKFPSIVRDAALSRLLTAAHSVTALTREIRRSLEDVCEGTNLI